MKMRPTIPTDLPTDPREAYLRGWRDRSAKAGRRKSVAKSEAARLNGAKGGRPRKSP